MSFTRDIESRIPPSTLASRLRDARTWRKLEQSEIAEAIDTSRATVSNYERGVTTPSRLQINAWAVICDVDVEWLKTGIVPEPDEPNPLVLVGAERPNLRTTDYKVADSNVIPMRRRAA